MPSSDAETLSALVREALQAESEEELFLVIARWLARHGRAHRASLALICEDDPSMAEIVALEDAEAAEREIYRLPLQGSGIGAAVLTGRLQAWEASPDSAFAEGAMLHEKGFRDLINAPLWSGNRVVGTLNFAKRRGHSISDDDITNLADMASVVSVNLDRFRLLSRTREELARERSNSAMLTDMTTVGLELSAATTRREVFDIAAEALVRASHMHRVSIGEVGPEGGEITVAAVYEAPRRTDRLRADASSSPRPVLIRAVDPPADIEPSMAAVVGDGRIEVWRDLAESDHADHLALSANGFRSALSMPVPVAGRVGAVINAASVGNLEIGPDQWFALQAMANLVGSVLDRLVAQEESERRARSLDALIDDSPLLMLTVTDDGRIARSSRYGAEQMGRSHEELSGTDLTSLYCPKDQDRCRSIMADLLDAPEGTVGSWEARMAPRASSQRWMRHTARRLGGRWHEPALLVVCEDITTVRRLSVQLEHEATHDPLTGLINRRELDSRLSAIEPGDEPFSLCFIDIDHFKLINDTSGHRTGDRVLVELTSKLQDLVARTDTLARHGGDELVLLLPGCGLADAVRVAERLRGAAKDLVFLGDGDHTHRVSLSIGVASLEQSGDAEAMLGDADSACNAAKVAGRDRVSTLGGVDRQANRRNGYWLERVRRALADGDLCLFGQAVVPTTFTEGSIQRFETLVRLNDDGELVAPGAFIPVCERYGLIGDIDRWVLTELVRLMVEHRQAFEPFQSVSLNLSAQSLESEEFLAFAIDAVSAPGLDTSKIVFEVTETVAMTNFQTAARFMESLSALGARFALDDFGTGFATYNYLKRLPLNVVKIDGSLIEELSTDPTDQEIVRSISQVARALGMKTVAERIESLDDLALLATLGVDYGQGYAIQRPRPIGEFLEPAANRLSLDVQSLASSQL